MFVVFLISGVLVGAWIVVLVLAIRGHHRERLRAQEETLAAVRTSTGLELVPELLAGLHVGAYSARGKVHGIEMTVATSKSVQLPGTSPSDDDSTVLATIVSCSSGAPDAAELPDQLVCRRGDADRVMGPLPAVRPMAVGDPEFDARYAVFVTPRTTAPQDHGGGYRDAQTPLVWADPKTLAALVKQGLVFARVSSGRCELAFTAGPAHAIAPLLATTANFVRRATGGSLVVATAPELAPARAFDQVRDRLLPAIIASMFAGPILGPVLAMTPPFRALSAEALCGEGGSLLGVDESFACSNGKDVGLRYALSAIALVVGLICAICTARALARWPQEPRRTAGSRLG